MKGFWDGCGEKASGRNMKKCIEIENAGTQRPSYCLTWEFIEIFVD